MLRIWEERTQRLNQPPEWRFSLEDPETGKRRGFADIQALINFLQAELASSRPEPAASQESQTNLSRFLQAVKTTLFPLSDAELDLAAAAGSDQPKPEEPGAPDDEEQVQ